MRISTISTNTVTAAPMVRIHPRLGASVPRPSIDKLLEGARNSHPEWTALFDHSCLHIPGAAHFMTVLKLCAGAPSERLLGYVEGLYKMLSGPYTNETK